MEYQIQEEMIPSITAREEWVFQDLLFPLLLGNQKYSFVGYFAM